MGLIPTTNTNWSDSLLLIGCMFEPYLARLRRHFSSDCLLNKFGPIRIGPGALLVPTPSPRTWSNSIWGPRPLYDLGTLPLQRENLVILFIKFYLIQLKADFCPYVVKLKEIS